MLTTITSVSGGKTSSYMALHYPTDYNIFACVLTTDTNTIPKDKYLRNYCQNKIPGFVGSRELDQTLLNLVKLEQDLGKEIIWVVANKSNTLSGEILTEDDLLTYDDLINIKNFLPNKRLRICTEYLKIYPIFWYCYLNLLTSTEDLILMNIGYRYDEPKRVNKNPVLSCGSIKVPVSCNINSKNKRNKQNLKNISWRIFDYPLYTNQVTKEVVESYWKNKNRKFPKVSNCDFCFFHKLDELDYQHKQYRDRYNWWIEQEHFIGKTFLSKYGYTDLLDASFNKQKLKLKETDSSCFCTD